MKKIYFIIVSICVIIFIYWIATSLPSVSNKLLTVTSTSFNNSKFSTSGNFAFKTSPEKPTLVKNMLSLTTDFITNPPIDTTKAAIKNIKNFHKLEVFFPDFKSYYTIKSKISNVLYNEIPVLYTTTSPLSDSDLKTYFNNNTKYIKETFGITDFNEFASFVSIIKKIDGKEIINYELENSYLFTSKSGTLNIRIILTLDDSTNIYIGSRIRTYTTTENLEPTLKFFDTTGGTSYV